MTLMNATSHTVSTIQNFLTTKDKNMAVNMNRNMSPLTGAHRPHVFAASMTAVLALLIAATTQAAPAPSTLLMGSDKGGVEFQAVGKPSLLRINGKGTPPKGEFTVGGDNASGTKGSDGKIVTGEITFDLATLDTGIEMRNSHMKEKYLEVGRFPQAKLKLTEVVLPSSWSTNQPEVKDTAFKGLLTLHGIEKPVSGTFSASKNGAGIGIDAKFTTKITDFGIEIPKYLGITVAEEVNVRVSMSELKTAAPAASTTTR